MNLKKAIGFGIVIWALMFVIVSIFIGFKIYDSRLMKGVTVVIAGIISYIFAGYTKPTKFSQALAYGASWVVIGIILDSLITVNFNPAIFTARSLWAGYALVLVAPLLRIKKSL